MTWPRSRASETVSRLALVLPTSMPYIPYILQTRFAITASTQYVVCVVSLKAFRNQPVAENFYIVCLVVSRLISGSTPTYHLTWFPVSHSVYIHELKKSLSNLSTLAPAEFCIIFLR